MTPKCLSKFCFCISLEQGAYIIAVLSIACIIALIGFSIWYSIKRFTFLAYLEALTDFTHVISCIVLFYGTYNRKVNCLIPFIVTSVLVIILEITGLIISAISENYEGKRTVYVLISSTYAAISIYFLLIIINLYYKLKAILLYSI